MWALTGCMTLDGFFFAPTATDAYLLGGDVIPADQVEEVTFAAADGVSLYGVWAHQVAGDAPVYVYFHGNADNIDAYWDRVEIYWSLGFEVFLFDYHGYGRSEGTPTYDTVMADGISAVEYVSDTTGRPASDLNYHGLSLGGSIAIHTAVALPPAVLITEDMFASARKLIDDGSGMELPDGWFVADPWDNVAAARELRRPYLILHGAEDTFIDPSHAEAVFDKANKPKELWLVPGADHDESPEAAPAEYGTRLGDWVAGGT